MPDEKLVALLKRGAEGWREWRQANPNTRVDLSHADLIGAHLSRADLSRANLSGTDLSKADLSEADLSRANLSEADLSRADLSRANLSRANLSKASLRRALLIGAKLNRANLSGAILIGASLAGANLSRANLSGASLIEANLSGANLSGANLSGADLSSADIIWANLSGADLSGANLSRATAVQTNAAGAYLVNCQVYGISAWDLDLTDAKQEGLVVTPPDTPTVTVDNLEVAQFIYLMLNNAKLRDVINTITSKVVLILGRFTPERKAVLNAFREELRRQDYTPVMFDFEAPGSRDVDETVSLLARMARFVVADITNARWIPQELKGFVESNPSIPVIRCIDKGADVPYDSQHWERYDWVLELIEYKDKRQAIELLKQTIPLAEAKVNEQRAGGPL